jgi:hypothetical protein
MRNVLLAVIVATTIGLAMVPASNAASVTVEGACYYNGNGAQDSATVTDAPSVDGPSQDNVEEGVNACANAAQDGSSPDGGSHVGASADAAGQSASVSSTTITNQLP